MLKKVSLWSYAVGLFLTPFAVLPGLVVPVDVVKIALLYITFGLSFFTWFIASIVDKKFETPRMRYFVPVIALFVASVVSLLASPSFRVSFAGFGFEPLSFMTILALLVASFMTSIHLSSVKRLKKALLVFLISGWVLTGVEFVFLLIGPGAWSFGLTNIKHLVLLSSWQSFIAYTGFLFIIGFWFNRFFGFSKGAKITAQIFLVLQFIFLVLGNVLSVNIAVLLSLILFGCAVYLTKKHNTQSAETATKKRIITFNKVILGLFALFFISSVVLPGIYSVFSARMGVSYVDIRPSFTATFGAQLKSIKNEHLFFGPGPARFDSFWGKYKPANVTLTNFASTKFIFGSSILTTLGATLGVLGVLAVVLFLLSVLMSLVRFLRVLWKGGDLDAQIYMLVVHMCVLYFFSVLALYVPQGGIVTLGFVSFGALVWASSQDKQKLVISLNPASKFKSVMLYVLSYLVALTAFALFVYSIVLFVGTLTTARALALLNKEGTTQRVEKELIMSAKLLRNDLTYNNLADFYSIRLRAITLDTKTPQDQLVEQFRSTFAQVEGWSLRSIQYDPTDTNNWQRIGSLYQSVIPFKVKGAYEGSKVAYQKLYELSPMSPDPDVLLARLELVNGNKDNVRKFIDQALAKKPNAINVMIFRSNLELEDGQSNTALAWAEKAVKTNTQNPNALYQLAFVQYKLGSYDDAVKTLAYLNQVTPNNIDVASLLVVVYEKSGKTNDAIALLEQIAQLYPNSKEVKDKLADLKNQNTTPQTTEDTTKKDENN